MRAIYISVIILSLIVIMLQCRYCLASDYEAWLDACAPYRAQVVEILLAEGISEDYYYLMVAESRCRDGAKSSAGAIGYWQLMPATARNYGCSEPHDLECATKAAARYLLSLSSRFSSWDRIIMAYNQGGHNLMRNGASAEARSLLRRVKEIMKLDKSRQ